MSRRYIGIYLNVIMLVAAAVLYRRLPDQVPTHWDFQGDVTDTMAKFPGAFLPSLIAIALMVLLPVMRRIDPRRASYDRFDATFYLVLNVVAVMMAVIEGLVLAVGIGLRVDMLRTMYAVVGLMFVVLGNYLPRIRSNWWMGIRTPWTLDNEEVWRRTHRLGGRTFVAGGIAVLLSPLLPREAATAVAVVSMMVAALVPAAWSYFFWKNEPTRRSGRAVDGAPPEPPTR